MKICEIYFNRSNLHDNVQRHKGISLQINSFFTTLSFFYCPQILQKIYNLIINNILFLSIVTEKNRGYEVIIVVRV